MRLVSIPSVMVLMLAASVGLAQPATSGTAPSSPPSEHSAPLPPDVSAQQAEVLPDGLTPPPSPSVSTSGPPATNGASPEARIAPAPESAATPTPTSPSGQAPATGSQSAGTERVLTASPPASSGPPTTKAIEYPTSSPATPVPIPPQPPAAVEAETPLYALVTFGALLQSVWNSSPAYDFFSDNDVLVMAGVSAGVDILPLDANAVLALDLNVATGSTSDQGPLPSYIVESELQRTDLGVGASARYALLPWVAPHVRVAGGASFINTKITGTDFQPLVDDSTNGYFSIGGGLTLTTPARRLSPTRGSFNSLALSVVAEAGYISRSDLDFALAAKETSDEAPEQNIAQAETPLGRLSQSGLYLRLSALARF